MKHSKKVMVSLTVVMMLFSCEKLPPIFSDGPIRDGYPGGVMVFDDYDDLFDHIDSTWGMSESEMLTYQSSEDYISFGYAADSLYDELDTTSTAEQVEDHIDANSDYLQITMCEDDSVYDTRYGILPVYYIMNEDRMYIVNDTVFRVFDTGVLSTYLSNYSTLKGIDDESYTSYTSDTNYIFYPFNCDIGPDDTQYELNDYLDYQERRGKDAIRLICLWYSVGAERFVQEHYTYNIAIRPQKRRFSIWWRVKRTMTTELYLVYDYPTQDDTWTRGQPILLNLSSVKDKNFFQYGRETTPWSETKTAHMSAYDFWVDTPSMLPLDISTNTGLINY